MMEIRESPTVGWKTKGVLFGFGTWIFGLPRPSACPGAIRICKGLATGRVGVSCFSVFFRVPECDFRKAWQVTFLREPRLG